MHQKIIRHIAVALFFCTVFALLLNANMQKELSHDEHMYVAGGELLSGNLMLPYRDYPYLQMPNLVFVYAAIFGFTEYNLLAARAFSTLCATLLLVVIFYSAWGLFGKQPHLDGSARDPSPPTPMLRDTPAAHTQWAPAGQRRPLPTPNPQPPTSVLRGFLVGAGSVMALIANPVFAYASGSAWNHDLAVLMAVSAFVLHGKAARHGKAGWLLLSGMMIGLAVGTRLAFAPAVIPFLAAILFFPSAARWLGKARLFLAFSAGLLAAMLPSILTFAQAPGQFAFGNAGYHGLNEIYRQETGYDRTMTIESKLVYLRDVVAEPGTLLLALSFLGSALALVLSVSWSRVRKPQQPQQPQQGDHKGRPYTGGVMNPLGRGKQRPYDVYFEVLFTLALVPFLLAGVLAPTPTWYQYYYMLVPFLVLGTLYAVAALREQRPKAAWGLGVLALAVIVSAFYGLPRYSYVKSLFSLDDWVPAGTHKVGLEIKAEVREGRVLTLSPIFPLEGGLEIYEEFATGPFVWRVASLMSEEERRELGIISAEDLESFLRAEPPRAILVGFEAGLDEPLAAYAKEHGYRAVTLSNGGVLWLSP